MKTKTQFKLDLIPLVFLLGLFGLIGFCVGAFLLFMIGNPSKGFTTFHQDRVIVEKVTDYIIHGNDPDVVFPSIRSGQKTWDGFISTLNKSEFTYIIPLLENGEFYLTKSRFDKTVKLNFIDPIPINNEMSLGNDKIEVRLNSKGEVIKLTLNEGGCRRFSVPGGEQCHKAQ